MPNLTAQLKRDGHLLAKVPPAKKQVKRIPKVSEKRKREAAIYSKKRKAFLEARDYCEVGISCNYGIGGIILTKPATDVHHVFRRGKNYLNESTWLPVCRPCHNWIHAHPKEARALGLLA